MKELKHKKSHYNEVAKKHGVKPQEVEMEIAEAIKFAFNAPDGSKEKQLFAELFPNGKVPSNEEFIEKMAARVMRNLGEK